ncbi:MAG: hypothetical protein OIF32_12455, partial [Campylobacterales bacterium]|nr:hypothetical protein [Campylobacterales bacterium]
MGKNRLLLGIFIIGTIFIQISFHVMLNLKTKEFEKINYVGTAEKQKIYLKALIEEKRNATLSLAIGLSKSEDLLKILKDPKSSVNLEKITLDLRENTKFKNVWFHLISKKGISLYRSWTEEKGDSVLRSRTGVKEMIKNPKITSLISVGQYDMTFKAMIPLFNKKKEFLGIFEVITHFNSISRKLREKEEVESVFLADKKFKNQLKKPLSKIFVDDFYVGNIDSKKRYLNFIKNVGSEKLIGKYEDYIRGTHKFFQNGVHIDHEQNLLITICYIKNHIENSVGYVVLFSSLDKVDMSNIEIAKVAYHIYSFFSILFLGIVLYFISKTQYQSEGAKIYGNKLVAILLLILFFASGVIHYFLENRLKADIEFFKEAQKRDTLVEYGLLEKKNQEIAELIFKTQINKKKIIDIFKKATSKNQKIKDRVRDELYKALKDG